jgi:hypothetical protein
MRLYALKKPDGTFDHQHVAREEGWVWDMAATFARMLDGSKGTTEQFKAAMEAGGYTVVPVAITEVEIDPDEKDQMHCQRCGVDISDADYDDNHGKCHGCSEVTP